jgi:uncharacterized membrane protein
MARDGGPERGDRRARFEALLAAIAAEPFDPEAVTDALAEQRRRGETRLGRFESALARTLAGMTPEERSAYAEALAERIGRR